MYIIMSTVIILFKTTVPITKISKVTFLYYNLKKLPLCKLKIRKQKLQITIIEIYHFLFFIYNFAYSQFIHYSFLKEKLLIF